MIYNINSKKKYKDIGVKNKLINLFLNYKYLLKYKIIYNKINIFLLSALL